MKYLWTFIWTFLLVQMLSYVAGNMLGASYEFQTSAILAVAATLLIYVIPAIIPDEPAEKKAIH
ncbi:YjzD family protein [Bacillus mesophilum]|uniref:YjzD family protein n=1 Tax=Bacillus mesophilum TaxID=1071718 RepID=A0A7V7UUG3_9BACI|nr:YjzD family protein [Bacillus mesophilum]KAB2331096.1 YjzD family protein [Bacillus mesophilum]